MPMSARVRSLLPQGGGLHGDTRRRRRLLLLVAAHQPVLALIAIIGGRSLPTIAVELIVVAALLVIAGRISSRGGSVALGLACVGTSAVVDELTAGMLGSLHGAVLLGAVATLLDWWAWWPALAGMLAVAASSAEAPLALVRALLVLLAAVGQLWWWQLAERELEADRAEAQRREREERALVGQLREVARIRDELIAVVGHELRTPLTAIRGFAKTLEVRGGQLDHDTVQVCLRTIDDQAARLERIVANVLLASDRHPRPQATPVDLGAVVHVVVAEARAAAGESRAVRERCEVGALVHLHPDVARALAVNLLDNAVAFAEPASTVIVRVRRKEGDVLLEVANRGKPMAESDLDRMFEPFVQADSSDSRKVGGIGLGLHVVRRLAESHGGTARARMVGGWIVFAIRLPAATATPQVPSAASDGDAVPAASTT